MKTYQSYEAAKIDNPECEIYVKCGNFAAEKDLGQSPHTYEYRGIEKCNPADHCMTVEKFLADGHKFVEGDLILDEGSVYLVEDCQTQKHWCETESANEPDCNDDRRYILRAAALEEKPKRTKVEYVKCEFNSAWEAIQSYEINDDLYYCASSTPAYEKMKSGNMKNLLDYSMPIKLYRRIETEIDERQEFIEFVESKCSDLNADGEWSFACIAAELFDSGRVKLLEQDD